MKTSESLELQFSKPSPLIHTHQSVSSKQLTLGFYDSGLGGFSVVKECLKIFSSVHIIYFADTAYCPLGVKPVWLIRERVAYAMNYLSARGTAYNFIACNTASIHSSESEKNRKNIRNTVSALCEDAQKKLTECSSPSILLLGTSQTIESQVYQQHLKNQFPSGQVIPLAADSLVSLVERSAPKAERYKVLSKLLSQTKHVKIDACALACTHFPFLKQDIVDVLGYTPRFINPANEMFSGINVLKPSEGPNKYSLVYSGYRPAFENISCLKNMRISEEKNHNIKIISTTKAI